MKAASTSTTIQGSCRFHAARVGEEINSTKEVADFLEALVSILSPVLSYNSH